MNTNVYIFSEYITIYKSDSEFRRFIFHSKKNKHGVLRSKNMGHKINGPKATQLQTIYISNQRKSKRSQSIPRALATPLP